jgi:flagellin
MGLRINQNIAAQNAYRNLSVTDNQMSKSLEKLSSGFRINRAADDAAGLSISEGLRAQVGGLKVAVRNAQDAISVVQTAEGALNEVTSMLQRMRDLAVQASNASLDSDAKAAAQKEFSQLGEEIDRIGETTAFGKSKLLDGSFGKTQELVGNKMNTAMPTSVSFEVTHLGDNATALATPLTISASVGADATAQDLAAAINASLATELKAAGYQGNEVQLSAAVASDGTGVTWTASGSTEFTLDNGAADLELAEATGSGASANPTSGDFQIGANAGEKLGVMISKMSTEDLGINTNSLSTTAGASAAITALDSALKTISDQRADLGAFQNRFEHTINNLNVSVENLSASESRIRDTDMAQEMVSFTRSQILTQAGTAMLSQANQASQNVLSLLR